MQYHRQSPLQRRSKTDFVWCLAFCCVRLIFSDIGQCN
jgi:hypothetical protein